MTECIDFAHISVCIAFTSHPSKWWTKVHGTLEKALQQVKALTSPRESPSTSCASLLSKNALLQEMLENVRV
jgi:hypothetical protein